MKRRQVGISLEGTYVNAWRYLFHKPYDISNSIITYCIVLHLMQNIFQYISWSWKNGDHAHAEINSKREIVRAFRKL